MTHADYFMMALCLWREARGEGNEGMTAVGCVVRNRVERDNSSYYAEIVKPWQFTSISVKADPEIALWPMGNDPQWAQAVQLSQAICDGTVADITGGATLYWNPKAIESDHVIELRDGSTVPFPQTWSIHAVQETVVIGQHVFLREI